MGLSRSRTRSRIAPMTAMPRRWRFRITLSLAWVTGALALASAGELWLTSPQDNIRFKRQTTGFDFGDKGGGDTTIEIRPEERFQTIDGFGFCLTGGSAGH